MLKIRIVIAFIAVLLEFLMIGKLLQVPEYKPSDFTPLPKHNNYVLATQAQIKLAVLEVYGQKMSDIVSCESGYRQYDKSGKVLTSGTNDIGIFQINESWIPTATEMGYDITKPADNFKFAGHILKVQGYNAWVCNR